MRHRDEQKKAQPKVAEIEVTDHQRATHECRRPYLPSETFNELHGSWVRTPAYRKLIPNIAVAPCKRQNSRRVPPTLWSKERSRLMFQVFDWPEVSDSDECGVREEEYVDVEHVEYRPKE